MNDYPYSRAKPDDDHPTIQTIAGEAYRAFETANRPDGEEFIRLRDGSPDWISELVRDAHGGDFLPDDWRYSTIREACGFIEEADGDDLEDVAHEFADGVDVYTGKLLAWLASNASRASYCDEAVNQLGADGVGIIQRIGLGQYMERGEVYNLVLTSLADRLAESEAETDDQVRGQVG